MTLNNMHEIPRHLPDHQRKFLLYANENFRPRSHQVKWCRVLLATGYEWDGFCGKRMEDIFREAERAGAIDYQECLELYENHGRNPRWTEVKEWFEAEAALSDFDKLERARQARRDEELRWYKYAPPMQAHYTYDEYVKLFGSIPEICIVLGWEKKAIIDRSIDCPIYWLEGDQDYPATRAFRYDNDAEDWIDLDEGNNKNTEEATFQARDQIEEALRSSDWDEVIRIATKMKDAT